MIMDKMIIRAIDVKSATTDAEAHKMTFVASDATRDSYGTVLPPKEWHLERFNSNPIIGYQHKVYGSWGDTEDPDNVIGKGYAYIDGDRLMVDIEFEPEEINPKAETIWKKLQWGSLNAVSVGFVAEGGHFGEGDEGAGKPNETYYYEGMELVEVSVVNIPANPNALKNAMKDEIDRLSELREAAIREEKKGEEPAEPKDPDKDAEARGAEKDKTVLLAEAALQLL